VSFGKRRRNVLIHHIEGPSIEGILMGRSHGHYILRVAKLKQDEDSSFTLDGEVRIPRERVAFYQVLD
jgi:hypothetical protein